MSCSPAVVASAAWGVVGSDIEFPSMPLDDEDWRHLLNGAATTRTLGLAAAAARAGHFPVTEHQEAELSRLERDGQCLALLVERLLVELVEELGGLGVDTRVLKGGATARLDYPDPGLRLFGDINLLVRADDLARTVTALTARGWRRRAPEASLGFEGRFGKGVTLVDPTGPKVDVHRTLAEPPFGLGIPVEDLWADRESFVLGGTHLSALLPEQRLIHACLDASSSRLPTLGHLRDIVQLAGKVDADDIVGLARAWQLSAVIAWGISQAWTTLQVREVPRLSAWAASYEPTAWERKALGRLRTPNLGYASRAVTGVRLVRGPRAKAAYLRMLAFPDRAHTRRRQVAKLGPPRTDRPRP